MKSSDKTKNIVSHWWRLPLEALYPDKKFDGQFQNPGSEEIFDFDSVMAIKQKRDDIKFLIFPRLFPEGSFEAHNMMFTTELLGQTFKKNQIGVGDFASLYNKLNSNTLEIATPEEV
jgi:hypothetical protein